jgi:hypothetical protein
MSMIEGMLDVTGDSGLLVETADGLGVLSVRGLQDSGHPRAGSRGEQRKASPMPPAPRRGQNIVTEDLASKRDAGSGRRNSTAG